MATIYWKGKATPVAQVTTVTPGGTLGTETFTLTVGGDSVSYTAQSGDTASLVADGLRDAWNNTTHPYFSGVTATSATGVVTLVADVPGVPFVVSGSATGAASLTVNTTTASEGPHDWSTAKNWSGNAVPANNDTVVISNSSVSILFGLNQASVTVAQLRIDQSYLGLIGLPEDQLTTADGVTDASKPEYRPTYLSIGATSIEIGRNLAHQRPAGSGRIKLNTGTVATQLKLLDTADVSVDANLEPVRWIGTHASNVIDVTGGTLGVATNLPGETATVATLNVGQHGNPQTDASVCLGAGVTLTTLNQSGGQVQMACGATTVDQASGNLETCGQGTLGTVHINGQAIFNSTGTLSHLVVGPGGVADFSQNPQSRVITTCQLHKSSQLNLDNANPTSLTLTNGIDFIHTEPAQTTLRTSPNVNITILAI